MKFDNDQKYLETDLRTTCLITFRSPEGVQQIQQIRESQECFRKYRKTSSIAKI